MRTTGIRDWRIQLSRSRFGEFSALLVGLCFHSIILLPAQAKTADYAQARHVADWLRHPVYGDPSFDAFERMSGNPIHRGTPPFEWPVNGFFFEDPVSGQWFVYVGDYGRGYVTPPSRCILYRSSDRGRSWTNLGVILHGDPQMFDKAGHTPDVSVVYAEGRYHMVYDWGEADFNAEGGLAYAWAERPEGPWHRAPQPITRNSSLPKLSGRYQRTYAATLLRRSQDWLILAMMDHAPNSWALFAMTAPRPEGPYSERRLVRQVEEDYFHPPLMEFFPAFSHDGVVYAPATSVALNRNFNAIFCAPLERADEASAWSIFQHGSVWHSEDQEAEHFGIWGQTFSGFVDSRGMLRAMFPSRDAEGRGTINLAQRPWRKPFRNRGFVLSAHEGPSLTLLRKAYDDFNLQATLHLRGQACLLLDYAAPLGPNTPSSDATLHPLMDSRYMALELAPAQWRLLRRGPSGESEALASGRLKLQEPQTVQLQRQKDRLTIMQDGKVLWAAPFPGNQSSPGTGVLGLRLAAHSHLVVDQFRIQGAPIAASLSFLWTEAVLGAGESSADWSAVQDGTFRYQSGAVSKSNAARAKWNLFGQAITLWSPRGPDYGKVEVRLDGRAAVMLDLHADSAVNSQTVWSVSDLPDTFHAVVLVPKSGRMPLDCLEVMTGR